MSKSIRRTTSRSKSSGSTSKKRTEEIMMVAVGHIAFSTRGTRFPSAIIIEQSSRLTTIKRKHWGLPLLPTPHTIVGIVPCNLRTPRYPNTARSEGLVDVGCPLEPFKTRVAFHPYLPQEVQQRHSSDRLSGTQISSPTSCQRPPASSSSPPLVPSSWQPGRYPPCPSSAS
jgi:hypothetical protein